MGHQTSSSRDQSIDIAKGIAILLVIFGHGLEIPRWHVSQIGASAFIEYKYIYSFHMPLFFLLSGWTFKNRNWCEIFIRAIGFITLAYFLHVVAWVSGLIFGQPQTDLFSLTALAAPFLSFDKFISIGWFLASLAIVQIAFKLFLDSSGKFKSAIFLTVVILFAASEQWNIDALQAKTAPIALLFFGIGYFASNKGNSFLRNPKLVFGPFFLLLTLALSQANFWCLSEIFHSCSNQLVMSMRSGVYGRYPIAFAGALSGALGIIYLAKAFVSTKYVADFLAYTGRHSLTLFLLNGIIFVHAALHLTVAIGSSTRTNMVALALVVAHVCLLPLLIRPVSILQKNIDQFARAIVNFAHQQR